MILFYEDILVAHNFSMLSSIKVYRREIMIALLPLPNSLFDSNLNSEDLYAHIYSYFSFHLEKEGYGKIEGFDYQELVDLESLAEFEKFYMPINIIAAHLYGLIRGIDVVVYAYLCYIAFESDNSTIKPNIGEIAMKTKIKKTEIRNSINNLVSLKILIHSSNSGYYSIIELKHPTIIFKTEALMRDMKKRRKTML
ncbi:hypothetical protein [Peribacillus tepidiphilus]|jgi:hypothetical protein|uniref:hypothetical protein n=1 Tax=Peribacillus tepidiphilus TaxID=2652445 RepID=UPI001290C73B|nr:hypothetical protein [Peribacillus tepidiphilus]